MSSANSHLYAFLFHHLPQEMLVTEPEADGVDINDALPVLELDVPCVSKRTHDSGEISRRCHQSKVMLKEMEEMKRSQICWGATYAA